MICTPAVRAVIRDEKIHQIYSLMQAGKKHGMQTMNDAFQVLYMQGIITKEEALKRSSDPNEFLRAWVNPQRIQHDQLKERVGKPIWRPSIGVPRPAAGGDIKEGKIELPSKEDVIAFLHKQRLIPVAVREQPKQFSLQFGTGITMRDIVIFTRQFATMINSGLPLVQSLDILAEQTENANFSKVLREVLYDVESGHTLAAAMGKHPKVFTELFVNMVAAGEAGGILDTILLRLATFLEKNDALIRKIKGVMVYPSVIFSVAGIAIVILLIFVIPTFQTMFESAGIPLPLPTRVVIGMSAFLQAFWWALAVGVVAAVFAIRAIYATPGGNLAIDRLLLAMPILGDLQRKAAVARFTRTLGTLVSSGVSILEGTRDYGEDGGQQG